MDSFWGILWIFFEAFVFVAYLMVLFTILIDLFRDEKLNGWWKALWVIFLIFVPFLTALVYLIARGKGMAERNARQRRTTPEDDDYYTTFKPSASPASDIDRAKQLLDQGTITQGEFDALKAKALGQRY